MLTARPSSSADEVTKKVTPPPEEVAEVADEPEETVPPPSRDEVVNCICRLNEENGLMIQASWAVFVIKKYFF